ncbi:MAG: ArnT family glycosyltransferase [Spirulinaceae cyanobacterium]
MNLLKKDKQFWFFVIIPIILFWLGCYALGLPFPQDDDLFFGGTAFNLAQSGEFVNPLIAQWSERTATHFFVQPPFFFYILAGWLSIWGISTKSILTFKLLCYITFSISTALLLKHYKCSSLATYAIAICFATWALFVGVRHDILGMDFLAIGALFLTRDRPFYYFWGFSFLGASILTAPILLVYAIPWGLALIYCNWRTTKARKKAYWIERIIAWIAAFLLNLILFLWCINFRFSQFLDDLSWHSSFRRQSLGQAIPTAVWIWQMGYGKIIHGSLLILLLSTSLLWLWHWSSTPKTPKNIILLFWINLILNLLIYASTVVTIFRFFSWVIVILITSEVSLNKLTRKLLIVFAIVVFFLNNSMALVTLALTQKTNPNDYAEILEYVEQNPEKNYVIDGIAARFVFNYQFPKNTISWIGSVPAPLLWPTSLDDKTENEVWIISAQKAWHFPELPDYPRVEIFGQKLDSIALRPYDILLIESEKIH